METPKAQIIGLLGSVNAGQGILLWRPVLSPNYKVAWKRQWGVGLFDFSRGSFCGDPPVAQIISLLGSANGGMDFSILEGILFVETPLWSKL